MSNEPPVLPPVPSPVDEKAAQQLREIEPQSPPPDKPKPTPRKLRDPITRPLWRENRGTRRRLLEEFQGHQVRVDRWYLRVASAGDQQYTGKVLAVATTTTGSTSDFLILQTNSGIVWAISTAQIAFLELLEPPRKKGSQP